MQDKFGKKLEEARMRKGISIRQASDDLKIRADFLLSFENDHGNFGMPIVYKAGFIKLYARYLKLDVKEIANDFDTYHRDDNKKNRVKEEREHLGRMEIIASEPPMILNPHSDFTPEEIEETSSTSSTNFVKTTDFRTWLKNPYVKTGLFFGTGLAFLTIIGLTVNNLIQPSSSERESIGLRNSTNGQSELASTIQHVAEQLVLLGESNIHIVVRQEVDKQRLFVGNIDKDHPVTITRKGPVKIHFSDGSKFSIQKPDGKIITPGRVGVGWIEI